MKVHRDQLEGASSLTDPTDPPQSPRTTVLSLNPHSHKQVPPARKKKYSKLWALMRSSALKEWPGISLPFPAALAEWEQEAAATLFPKARKQWARMWRLSESPCPCCSPWNGNPAQNKDQLT